MDCEKKIDRIEKVLYGNGDVGLIETIGRLDENVKTLVNTDQQLTTTVSALVKFMTDLKATEKATEKVKKEMKGDSKWLIGILITINLALIAAIITLLNK